MSALEDAGRLPGTAYKGATMYTTLSPCKLHLSHVPETRSNTELNVRYKLVICSIVTTYQIHPSLWAMEGISLNTSSY